MPSPTISETQYYLRWWLVDQLLALCGRGVFRATPALLRVYYRLLGARIGRGAIIDRRAKVPPIPSSLSPGVARNQSLFFSWWC